jgi:hypothetical protein
MNKTHIRIPLHFAGKLVALTACFFVPAIAAAQPSIRAEQSFVENFTHSGQWWFAMILIVITGLGLAFFLWRKSSAGKHKPQINGANRYKNYYSSQPYEVDSIDAERDIESLRRAKKQRTDQVTKFPIALKPADPTPPPMGAGDELDTHAFQMKMRRMMYNQLPINGFSELSLSNSFLPLPVSQDPSLLNAIEQANEEYEEDEAIRETAIRVLAAFKTANSIEALAQMALYDLSSTLRSKAVNALTDFDHESVFEPILAACADPTREVRAAAARGLFKLNFERADAWKRLIETRDDYRMCQAVRSAAEAGLVAKSFERLIHEDLKVAGEAFALVALIVHSGETDELFEALTFYRDDRVKLAILHVLRVLKDFRTLERLTELRVKGLFEGEIAEKAQEAINSISLVHA